MPTSNVVYDMSNADQWVVLSRNAIWEPTSEPAPPPEPPPPIDPDNIQVGTRFVSLGYDTVDLPYSRRLQVDPPIRGTRPAIMCRRWGRVAITYDYDYNHADYLVASVHRTTFLAPRDHSSVYYGITGEDRRARFLRLLDRIAGTDTPSRNWLDSLPRHLVTGEVVGWDDGVRVITRRNSTFVNESEVDELVDMGRIFYCTIGCEYYNSYDYEQVVLEDTGDIACEGNAYCWDDGEFRSYEEPERSDGLVGYHDGPRRGPTAPYQIGVELEIAVRESDRESWVESYVDKSVISPEEDGSLDEYDGVELVQIAPKDLDGTICTWKHIFEAIESQSGLPEYGMHVNMNTYGWTQGHVDNFVAFWHLNEDLVRHFAKRGYVHWAKKTDGDLHDIKRYSGDKYTACAIRGGGRCEVRIFRTTHNFDLFRARCQLVDAVARWCKTKPRTISQLTNITTGRGNLRRWMRRRPRRYTYALRYLEQWIGAGSRTEEGLNHVCA